MGIERILILIDWTRKHSIKTSTPQIRDSACFGSTMVRIPIVPDEEISIYIILPPAPLTHIHTRPQLHWILLWLDQTGQSNSRLNPTYTYFFEISSSHLNATFLFIDVLSRFNARPRPRPTKLQAARQKKGFCSAFQKLLLFQKIEILDHSNTGWYISMQIGQIHVKL